MLFRHDSRLVSQIPLFVYCLPRVLVFIREQMEDTIVDQKLIKVMPFRQLSGLLQSVFRRCAPLVFFSSMALEKVLVLVALN